MSVLDRDVAGFSREARQGQDRGGLCFDLLMALDDELKAEEIINDPGELQRRYRAVVNGDRPCPLQESCEKYRRALARGARVAAGQPRQLQLPFLVSD